MDLLQLGIMLVLAGAVGGGAGAWARGSVRRKNHAAEKAIEAKIVDAPRPKKSDDLRQLITRQDDARHVQVTAERAALLEEMRVKLSAMSNTAPQDRVAAVGLIINYLSQHRYAGCKNYEHDREDRVHLIGQVRCFAPHSCPEKVWERNENKHSFSGKTNPYGLFAFTARLNLFHTSTRSYHSQRELDQGFTTQLKNMLSAMSVFPQQHAALKTVDEIILAMATYLHDVLRPSVEKVPVDDATAHTTESLRAKALKAGIPKVTAYLKEQQANLSEDDISDALFQAAPVTTASAPAAVEFLPSKLPYQELLGKFDVFIDSMSPDQKRKHEKWSEQVKAATEMVTMAAASTSPRQAEIMELAQGNYDLAEAGLQHLLRELQDQADADTMKQLRVTQVFLSNEMNEETREDV